MFVLASVVIGLFTVLGSVVFGFAWRARHPGRLWPLFAWISFASGLVFALGMAMRSAPILCLGLGIAACGWLLTKRAARDF